jgi:hypothetical protein
MSKKNKKNRPTDLNEVKEQKQMQQNEEQKQLIKMQQELINIFRFAIKDRLEGLYRIETMNILEGAEIEPILAYKIVDQFIARINNDIQAQKLPNIRLRQLFYAQICEMFLPKKIEQPVEPETVEETIDEPENIENTWE